MFINDYIHNTVNFDILITGFSTNALYCGGMKWAYLILRRYMSRLQEFSLHKIWGASMWFWSVSLADQLHSQFHFFFGQTKKNCPVSEIRQFLLPTLLIFFYRLFWKLVTLEYLDWTKKTKKADKKNCRVPETGQFFWADQINEKWPIGLPRDWPKPHGGP